MRPTLLDDLASASGPESAHIFQHPRALADAFLRRMEEIKADPRLTVKGREDAALSAARATLADLERWHVPHREGGAKHMEVTRAQLATAVARPRPTDPARALEAALVRQEIRRAAADLSDGECELLARSDPDALDALTETGRVLVSNGAARFRPFISNELRDEILLERAGALRPDLASELAATRETVDRFRTAANVLKGIVADAVPGAVAEPAPRILA